MAVRIEAARREETKSCPPRKRSARSLAFQQAWAAIPKQGFIPDKSDFRPESLAPFLNDIYLVEFTGEAERRLVFRLAGQTIRDALGIDLRGLSYADFVPEEHRFHAGKSMELMFGPHPCGRWIGKDIAHLDGYREPVELTQFPMLDRASGTRLILGIAEGFGMSDRHEAAGKFCFECREAERFIDIGAGLPG
ncbi:MAG: hypothetical protein C0454_10485 [Parvibaculum sp.]|nr:hypothetical protein [Parvibaculum sp.]